MHTFEAHYDALFSEVGPTALQADIQKYQNPSSYISIEGKNLTNDPLYGVFYHKVAHLMEPVDPVLGVNSQMLNYNAFLKGTVPALHLANRFLTLDFLGAMEGRAIGDFGCSPDVMPKDLAEKALMQASIADNITDAAERGWAEADGYHDILEDLFDTVEYSVIPQITMRRGFGFVMGLVVATHESRTQDDLAELNTLIAEKDAADDENYDLTNWDAAAGELFTEEAARKKRED